MWPFILEYFKGNGFPTNDIISTHSQSQCSIVNGNMPKLIIDLLLWKCSYRWMKQPLFYCFENNSKQNRSKNFLSQQFGLFMMIFCVVESMIWCRLLFVVQYRYVHVFIIIAIKIKYANNMSCKCATKKWCELKVGKQQWTESCNGISFPPILTFSVHLILCWIVVSQSFLFTYRMVCSMKHFSECDKDGDALAGMFSHLFWKSSLV